MVDATGCKLKSKHQIYKWKYKIGLVVKLEEDKLCLLRVEEIEFNSPAIT